MAYGAPTETAGHAATCDRPWVPRVEPPRGPWYDHPRRRAARDDLLLPGRWARDRVAAGRDTDPREGRMRVVAVVTSAILDMTVMEAVRVPGVRDVMVEAGNEAVRTALQLGHQIRPIIGMSDLADQAILPVSTLTAESTPHCCSPGMATKAPPSHSLPFSHGTLLTM